MRLQRAGAIRTHVGRPAIRTTMILGSADLYEWAGEGNVLLSRVEDTHDAQSLGGVDDFFAINSALQVGLNGDVNSEVAGGRYTGAVGGLADFAEAATASTGGTSVIVLPSTAKGGRESRIVSPGPEVVSLPHRYVGAVITEFGAARLVGPPVVAVRVRPGRLLGCSSLPRRKRERERVPRLPPPAAR